MRCTQSHLAKIGGPRETEIVASENPSSRKSVRFSQNSFWLQSGALLGPPQSTPLLPWHSRRLEGETLISFATFPKTFPTLGVVRLSLPQPTLLSPKRPYPLNSSQLNSEGRRLTTGLRLPHSYPGPVDRMLLFLGNS